MTYKVFLFGFTANEILNSLTEQFQSKIKNDIFATKG